MDPSLLKTRSKIYLSSEIKQRKQGGSIFYKKPQVNPFWGLTNYTKNVRRILNQDQNHSFNVPLDPYIFPISFIEPSVISL